MTGTYDHSAECNKKAAECLQMKNVGRVIFRFTSSTMNLFYKKEIEKWLTRHENIRGDLEA